MADAGEVDFGELDELFELDEFVVLNDRDVLDDERGSLSIVVSASGLTVFLDFDDELQGVFLEVFFRE